MCGEPSKNVSTMSRRCAVERRPFFALMEDHVARFVVDGLHALAERGDVVVGERIEQRNAREEQLVAVLVGHEKRITEGSEV